MRGSASAAAEASPRRIAQAEAVLNGREPSDATSLPPLMRRLRPSIRSTMRKFLRNSGASWCRPWFTARCGRPYERSDQRLRQHMGWPRDSAAGRPGFGYGQGRFTSDLPAAHWCASRAVQLPRRHQEDHGAAGAMVVTAADLAGIDPVRPMLHKFEYKPIGYPLLADGVVRFVGECVAAAVASTEEEAEDIVDLIEMEIDERQALVDSRTRSRKTRRACIRNPRTTSLSKVR